MFRRRLVAGLLAVGLAVTFSGFASAEEKKTPKPLKVLKKVTRNLAKTRTYRASCEVQGGLSKTKDHQISQMTVRESYQADIYKNNLMYVPELKAYRTSSKGAIYDATTKRWYNTLSLPTGKKLERLFAFPLKILQEASTKPEQIEWLASPDDEEEVVEESEGRTAVVRKVHRIPHRMRVRVSDKIALERFTEVQNSGCLSGG
ncbi:MAG: hypothetical protein ACE5GW_09700 [Planctomycetota bacterium]